MCCVSCVHFSSVTHHVLTSTTTARRDRVGTRKVPEVYSPNISGYVQAAAEQTSSSGPGADRLVDDERCEGQTAITLHPSCCIPRAAPLCSGFTRLLSLFFVAQSYTSLVYEQNLNSLRVSPCCSFLPLLLILFLSVSVTLSLPTHLSRCVPRATRPPDIIGLVSFGLQAYAQTLSGDGAALAQSLQTLFASRCDSPHHLSFGDHTAQHVRCCSGQCNVEQFAIWGAAALNDALYYNLSNRHQAKKRPELVFAVQSLFGKFGPVRLCAP